jgi:colicin import membrane protein
VNRLNTATLDYDLLDQMIMEDAYEADLRAANNVAREADERAREAESRTREAELRANEMEKDLSIERKAKREAVKRAENERIAKEDAVKRAENERIAKEEAVIAMEVTLKEIEKLKAELNKRK